MVDLREALRVDFSSKAPIKHRLSQRSNYEKPESALPSDETDAPILPGCSVARSEIMSMYPDDPVMGEKVAFVIKICLAQLECGQATVDAEEYALRVALGLGLDSPRLDLGPRGMTAKFGGGPTHILETKRNIILCKLQDVTDLAILVAAKYGKDVVAASSVLDEIMEEPLPYGWLVADFMFWLLSTLAAICAFFGSYYDMACVAIISLAVLMVRYIISAYPRTLQALEVMLVSIVIGFFSAIGWRYVLHPRLNESICNVSVLFLSPLLVYLPGSELLYGTYEIKMGNIIVGASRLVAAVVRCIFMGLGLTIGWQFVGYNAIEVDAEVNGNTSSFSLVPSARCAPFTGAGVQPWWLVFAVYNIIMLFPVLAGLNVHPRGFFGPYAVAYPSLLVFGALNFAFEHSLPSYIVNAIGLFIATNLACLREFMTGNPAVSF